jgi:hypothetical protein
MCWVIQHKGRIIFTVQIGLTAAEEEIVFAEAQVMMETMFENSQVIMETTFKNSSVIMETLFKKAQVMDHGENNDHRMTLDHDAFDHCTYHPYEPLSKVYPVPKVTLQGPYNTVTLLPPANGLPGYPFNIRLALDPKSHKPCLIKSCPDYPDRGE